MNSENVVSRDRALTSIYTHTLAMLTHLMKHYHNDKHVTTELNRAYNLVERLYQEYFDATYSGKHTIGR